MSDFFNEAYRHARSRFTADQWLALAPQQVTQAIYQAMRELDAATVHRVKRPRGTPAKPTVGEQPAES